MDTEVKTAIAEVEPTYGVLHTIYLQVSTGKVYDLSAYLINWKAMPLPFHFLVLNNKKTNEAAEARS